jgi:hypothetical protein
MYKQCIPYFCAFFIHKFHRPDLIHLLLLSFPFLIFLYDFFFCCSFHIYRSHHHWKKYINEMKKKMRVKKQNTTYVFFFATRLLLLPLPLFLVVVENRYFALIFFFLLLSFFFFRKKCMYKEKCARAMNQRRTFDLINDCYSLSQDHYTASQLATFSDSSSRQSTSKNQQQQLVCNVFVRTLN